MKREEGRWAGGGGVTGGRREKRVLRGKEDDDRVRREETKGSRSDGLALETFPALNTPPTSRSARF